MPRKTTSDIAALAELNQARQRIEAQLHRVIIGQDQVLEQIMICLLAGGHGLLIGVPGLAKTLIVNTLSRVLHLGFKRIQFTPDLMPSDITGTEILETDPRSGARDFRFVPGPVFTNIVLADEINRTPPKTQSALLEAMQEYRVTVGGETRPLPRPFLVLATQNPIEMEGTYPLPEAQLDRFMLSITIDYPSASEERAIVQMTTSAYEAELTAVLDGEAVLELQRLLRRVPVADDVVDYAVGLAARTRPGPGSPPFIRDWVSWGAGPRASQYLVLAGKARAALHGNPTPTTADIRAVALPVLRHRLVTSFGAEADGVRSDRIVEELLREHP